MLYGEDVYVGYRFYESVAQAPLFPFGHGLSYTSFGLSELSVIQPEQGQNRIEDQTLMVNVTVANVGSRAGAEIVQVYISPPASSKVCRPDRELKGFQKVHLQPGEKRAVYVSIPLGLATSFWDEGRSAWLSEAGTYSATVVGTDSSLSTRFTVSTSRWWKGLGRPTNTTGREGNSTGVFK